MDRIALHAFMVRHRFGVVSSISGDGTPQSALVGIAITAQLEIIFDTVRSSRKYPNLIARPVCSFVVGWTGEQTVQFEGHATEPNGPDLKRYQEIYFAAWPECEPHMNWPGIAYFVVRPRCIRYSDYDQKTPHHRRGRDQQLIRRTSFLQDQLQIDKCLTVVYSRIVGDTEVTNSLPAVGSGVARFTGSLA